MKRLITLLFLAVALLGAANRPKDFSKEQARIQKLVDKYQKSFRFNEHLVYVKLATIEELDAITGPGHEACGASVDVNEPIPHVLIWVLRSDQYARRSCYAANIKIDQENTVAHEFVHQVLHHTDNEEFLVSILTDNIKHSPQLKKKK